ncbi:MAG: (d)CMP kinase [Desulfobacterales bacterium]|nr:(d)CMP kinase [Desulfobacterales bacterium]
MKKLLITIDGPAGAGKTSVSRTLAEKLGYQYIDTGALYRGVAYEVKSQGIDPENETDRAALCGRLQLAFKQESGELRLYSVDKNISGLIRTPEISLLASAVSAKSVVRAYLLDVQRKIGQQKAAVFEGRDMGTVVFPAADVKFFLDASSRIRARRRYDELKSDSSQSLKQVEADMQRRDGNDRSRSLAPLKPADDAILIDSTDLTIQEVVDTMLSHIARLKGQG